MKKIKKIFVIVTIISMFSVLGGNFITLNEFEGRHTIYNKKDWDTDLDINPRTSGNITIFEDDFESGLSKWNSISGYWNLTNTSTSWPPPWNPCHSPTHSMWFGDNTTGTYDNGTSPAWGYLISIPIDLSSVDNAYLEFYHWKDVEDGWDFSYVQISNDSINWNNIYTNWIDISPWERVNLDISSYCGNNSVRISFYFNTWDPIANNFRGWLVDDV